MLSSKIKTSALAIAVAVSGTFAAQASTVDLKQQEASAFGTPSWGMGTRYILNGNEKYHGAGLFRLEETVSGKEVLAWCIDLFTTLDLANNPTHDTSAPAASAAQMSNIDRLFTSAYDQVVGAASAAAFQLALWEIMTDTDDNDPTTGLSLEDGDFKIRANNVGSGRYGLAQDFLDGLATANSGSYTLTTYFSDDSQNLVSGTPVPGIPGVPVPASALLLLTGVAGFGALRRRRKS